jgi:hypothetical protein
MEFWRLGMTLQDVEKKVILEAFHYFQNNKTRTAKALDIAIRTLDSKLEQYASPQSVIKVSKEPPLPVPERKEVQTVSLESITKNDSNERRVAQKNRK